jgi:hypothetical protein
MVASFANDTGEAASRTGQETASSSLRRQLAARLDDRARANISNSQTTPNTTATGGTIPTSSRANTDAGMETPSKASKTDSKQGRIAEEASCVSAIRLALNTSHQKLRDDVQRLEWTCVSSESIKTGCF